MRYLSLPILTASIALLSSCYSPATTDDIETAVAQKTKDVQFVIKGITEEYSTRATIESVGMTDLWIYEGESLLKHTVSTDADFSTPTVSLTYGSHDLTFVTSKADGQTFSASWTCTKVKDTFAKAQNVTVSANSSNSRQVELKRRSSQVCFMIEDAVPTSVKTMHLTASNHLSLSASLAGTSATTYEATMDVTSYQGSTTFKPTINLLSASSTDEEDCDIMIEFLSSSNAVLYHYERTIKLKPNRCTTLKGSYFSGGSNTITVDNTWLDELVVDLFSAD